MFDRYDDCGMPEQPEPEPLKLGDILAYRMPGETLQDWRKRRFDQYIELIQEHNLPFVPWFPEYEEDEDDRYDKED
jgi:hypothetical protein